MTEDDLDQRKEDVWSMTEVRSATSETPDTPDSSDRIDKSDTTDTSETSDTEERSDTTEEQIVRQMAIDAEEKNLAVRDLHNVNVYLYEDIYQDMVATFKELDSEYFRKHGDDLSKNKDFFNAVFRAGLQSPQLREELGLKEAK